MDIFAPPLVPIQVVQTMSRVDKNLFEEDHYLGKPADATDLLVSRRLELLEGFEGFFDSNCDLIEIGCGNGNTTVQVAPRFRSARGLNTPLSTKVNSRIWPAILVFWTRLDLKFATSWPVLFHPRLSV